MTIELADLAKDILTLAASGGMPDTFWQTDQRIERACVVLGWTPEKAREYGFSYPRGENSKWTTLANLSQP